MTTKFNFVAAKVLAIGFIVYSILLILLYIYILLIDNKGFDSPLTSFLSTFIPQSISYLLLVATFCYLAYFFRLIGYKAASVCIYLFLALSLFSFAATMLYSYQLYNPDNGINSNQSDFARKLLILLPYILQAITHVSSIILAVVILTTTSDYSVSSLVRPVGIRYLIYSIICLLMFILYLLSFNLLFSSYITELDTKSFVMVMQYRFIIHLVVVTIPFVIVYIAIVRMYNNYQKMIEINEEEAAASV